MTALAHGESALSTPSARTVRHALGVLERLPAEAMAELAERLDTFDGDSDLEVEEGCEVDDAPPFGMLGPGDEADAEPGEDDEPDETAVVIRYTDGRSTLAEPVRAVRVR